MDQNLPSRKKEPLEREIVRESESDYRTTVIRNHHYFPLHRKDKYLYCPQK